MTTTPATAQIHISRIDAETLIVPIIGTAPLIVHRFSEKAKKQMLDNMQGRKTPREAKDPQAEYEAAFYRTKDGYGFPMIAFKNATVEAADFYGKSVTKVSLRKFLFFKGVLSDADPQPLAVLIGEPRMREDVVTVGISGHDLRYRPEFLEWSTELEITYVKSSLTRDSVLSLVDAGGLGVGVGEWRPQKKGDFGTYRIDPTRDVTVAS